jgi:hypothetical protein
VRDGCIVELLPHHHQWMQYRRSAVDQSRRCRAVVHTAMQSLIDRVARRTCTSSYAARTRRSATPSKRTESRRCRRSASLIWLAATPRDVMHGRMRSVALHSASHRRCIPSLLHRAASLPRRSALGWHRRVQQLRDAPIALHSGIITGSMPRQLTRCRRCCTPSVPHRAVHSSRAGGSSRAAVTLRSINR